jgi:hypothetical protein
VGAWGRGLGFKNGKVDELKVYNRLVSPYEITVLAEKAHWNNLLTKPFTMLNEQKKCAQRLFYISQIDACQTMVERNNQLS